MVASGIGVSVISAAILEGNLILGLSDGSVINAGVAQGPMGLTGPQGPVGATGRPGRDGNTIHSVEGAPSYDLGTEGDFAINTVEWEVYGPKASGQWGKGTPMIGGGGRNKREVNKGGDTRTEGGGGDGRPPIVSPDGDLTPPTQYPGAKPIKNGDFWVDGNGALHVYYRGGWHKIRVYSDMVLPAGDAPAGSSRDVEGSVTVPGNGGTGQAIAEAANGETFANQYEYNNWAYYRVDRPPIVADDEPAEHPNFPVTGLSTGDFWINAGDQLFTWKDSQWTPLFAKGLLTVQDTMPDPAESQEGELWFNTDETHLTLYVFDGAVWVPAAPPVSLEGIENSIASVDAELLKINANVAMNKRDIDEARLDVREDQKRQDERLDALESNSGGDDFLPTAGGELKGTLQINGSMDKKIDPLLCRADGYYMTFGVTKTGEVLAGSSPGLPFMAVDNWHVVTKGYLDSRLPEQGLFHETWWTFRASADRSDCEKGEFCADDGDFFMSDKNEDNHTWGPNIAGGRNTQMFVTIYSSEGKLCHTYEVNKIHFHEKYTKKYITEFDWTWTHVSNALVDGAKYKIVVPGFLT